MPENSNLSVSVIISTYNEPEWLRKVLVGYNQQTYSHFEVLIADDGSGPDTKQVIDDFLQSKPNFSIKHIWHPDTGYNKCGILNKAIVASKGNYLIFTDGDCIPRKDFVEVHATGAEKQRFLSGGALRLPMDLSTKISNEDIEDQRVFDREWMEKNGLPKSFKNSKLSKNRLFTWLMGKITPAKASWNGGNASTFKEYVLAVNGFNEDMHYGGQDREFGERLQNLGLKGKQVRYSAICVHLEHHRAYKTDKSIKKNQAIRKETRQTGNSWVENGIKKGSNE